ncbi:MAG: hypothetical protein K2M07_01100 [Muribaculaceae bacterium]|nr:hypothetical protein [Muribaculaceae bacterium]
MKENITQQENNEKQVKESHKTVSPKQSTLDFIMQFARSCRPVAAKMPAGLNVISAN